MVGAAQDEADLDVLLRDWSLTKGDLQEVHRARGEGACGPRCICAVFVAPGASPMTLNASRTRPLSISPADRHPSARPAVSAVRAGERRRHPSRVREHLGFVPFSADAEAGLKDNLAALTLDGLAPRSWSSAPKLFCCGHVLFFRPAPHSNAWWRR